MPEPHAFPSAAPAAASGRPRGAAYVYRGTGQQSPDPGAVTARSRRDEATQRTGAAIRAARLAAGLSQHDTAHAAGITAGYLSAIENGHDMPATDKLAALAAVLGLAPEDLRPTAPRAPEGAVTARPSPAARADRPSPPTSSAAGTDPKTPGPSAGAASAGGPGTSAGAGDGEGASPALRGEAWRKAARAELSSQHAAQRRGRVRRAPKPIAGIVKPPPGGER